MSKRYPFFKFCSDEWNSGLIAVEDMEAQGLFINICSLLWSKESITKKHIAKRFRTKCKADVNHLLDTLEADALICYNNDNIEVKFIARFKNENEEYSLKQSERGRKGGNTKANNLAKPSKPLANKSLELRVKNIKESNTIVLPKKRKNFKNFTEKDFLNEIELLEEYKEFHNEFFVYWTEPTANGLMKFQTNTTWETKRRLATWASNNFNNKKQIQLPDLTLQISPDAKDYDLFEEMKK